MKPGSTVQQIVEAQRAWASRRGIELRDPYHTRRLEDNLLDRRLSPAARSEFKAAAGQELGNPRHPDSAPGLSALLSSAALVYNVFDYWRHRDKRVLAEVCGAEPSIDTLVLERRFAIWRGGTPPHLDVLLDGRGCLPTAIESKFTEPYHRATNSFEKTYFIREKVWQKLPACYRLAERVRDEEEQFESLAAAQLIKHVLGLTKKLGAKRFRLLYLWYRWPGPEAEADRHVAELERFRTAVADEVVFETRTYQEVFAVLRRAGSEHRDYVRYLQERYFREAAEDPARANVLA